VAQLRFSGKSRALKLAARRQAVLMAANRKAARDAKAMRVGNHRRPRSWIHPAIELLKSLPQLNQTVDELKSFLPVQPK